VARKRYTFNGTHAARIYSHTYEERRTRQQDDNQRKRKEKKIHFLNARYLIYSIRTHIHTPMPLSRKEAAITVSCYFCSWASTTTERARRYPDSHSPAPPPAALHPTPPTSTVHWSRMWPTATAISMLRNHTNQRSSGSLPSIDHPTDQHKGKGKIIKLTKANSSQHHLATPVRRPQVSQCRFGSWSRLINLLTIYSTSFPSRRT